MTNRGVKRVGNKLNVGVFKCVSVSDEVWRFGGITRDKHFGAKLFYLTKHLIT